MKEYSYSPLNNLLTLPVTSAARVKITWGIPFLAYSLLAIFFMCCLGLIFIPWMQTVPGIGQVIGYYVDDRRQEIQAPVDGRIKKWHVTEGSKIKAGEPLVDIVDLDPHIVERLEQERDAAKVRLDSTQVALDTSYKNLERQQTLARKGLSSVRSLELAQIEYQKFLSDYSSARAELTRIESRISRQANQTLVAPRDGIIMRIDTPQGEGILVKAGTPLARLVPETDQLAVEIRIRGNDMPLVSEGRLVRLQFEGWPAIQFAGWPNVAVGTFPGVVKVIDPSDDGTGHFRVIISPAQKQDWPSFPYLRQGVRAHGWILLDSVSLGWEIWRQLNGFPPSVRKAPIDSQPGKLQ